MKEERNIDFLSGVIPLLFANFWSGEKDTEQVIEEFIKERADGREERKSE